MKRRSTLAEKKTGRPSAMAYISSCVCAALLGCATASQPTKVKENISTQIPKPLRTADTPANEAVLELIIGAMKAASAGIMSNEKAAAVALGLQIKSKNPNGNSNEIVAGIPILDLGAERHIQYRVIDEIGPKKRWWFSIRFFSQFTCVTKDSIEKTFGKSQNFSFPRHDNSREGGVYYYYLYAASQEITAAFSMKIKGDGSNCLDFFDIQPKNQL